MNVTARQTTGAENIVDAQGTTQSAARRLLTNLRERGFQGQNQLLALALGRPAAEIAAWLDGTALLDDDVAMKIRGIAQERNINLEEERNNG